MSHPDTQLTKILRYAKNASPQGLRTVLRPVVRRVLPEELRARVREPDSGPASYDLTAADTWVDNRYTILDNGTKRHFFFLRGCYKSGTHWVQNLINLHPHAFMMGEFHFEVFRRGVDHLTGPHWFLCSEPSLREVVIETSELLIRRAIFTSTRSRPDAIWLGDRTPSPLQEIIRGAPQIFITRDVRDVLISWSFHHMMHNKSELDVDPPFREKWREASAKCRQNPETFHPLDGLLGHEGWVRHHAAHWADVCRQSRKILPKLREADTPVLELRYEQLHADLSAELSRLYAFLDLDPSLAEPPSEETKTLPGFKREDRRSFFRKGAVGEWQEILTDRLCTIIKEEAGEELIAAGYEQNLNW